MKSRLQENDEYCYICQKRLVSGKDLHHIFNGPHRNKSDEDGLVVYVHRTCHRWLHDHPISNITFKQRGQRYYEEHIGTREEFIKRYGKSYL